MRTTAILRIGLVFLLNGPINGIGNAIQAPKTSGDRTTDSMVPVLEWRERSDWLNIKTDITPPARGNGQTDDTAALQTALDKVHTGSTVYLPPGVYRITRTLELNGPLTGVLIVGHGRKTRIVWDGPEGGVMFHSNGVAYSRYVGLVWDGRGRAAVAFDHAAKKRFETEVTHHDEAFLNCTAFGIRIGWKQKVASAEILYRNCLFENCGVGIGFLAFNDYDNTVDRCEFRSCGVGIKDRHGNFYVRNSRFAKSRRADFDVLSEHGSSIRRCTSFGSKMFLLARSIVGPLVVQDCRVVNWTATDGAVDLACAPVLMFDCVFEQPPPGCAAAVRVSSSRQRLILANVTAPACPKLLAAPATAHILQYPIGEVTHGARTARRRSLDERPRKDGRIFDARRDFGAIGDGRADDTAAVQAAIVAAARARRGAVAYLPFGRYRITRTLTVTGREFRIEGGGSGFRTCLVWDGSENGIIIHVQNVRDVVIRNLAVGHGDLSPRPTAADILYTSAIAPSSLILDYVFVYGLYRKEPDRGGLVVDGLSQNDSLLIEHLQGNIRIRNSGSARILARTSYEGTLTITGTSDSVRFPGFLTRLATITAPALRVRANGSVVISDFYVEQALSHVTARGRPDLPPGRITLQQPKVQINRDVPVLNIDGYRGRITFFPAQFYRKPENEVFSGIPGKPFELLVAGAFFYGVKPVFAVTGGNASVACIGNAGTPDIGDAADLVRAALDDLRRLGRMDADWPAPSSPASAK